jgi:hypothetical protein
MSMNCVLIRSHIEYTVGASTFSRTELFCRTKKSSVRKKKVWFSKKVRKKVRYGAVRKKFVS